MYAIIKSLEIGASHLYGVQESAEEDISEFDDEQPFAYRTVQSRVPSMYSAQTSRNESGASQSAFRASFR